MKVDIWKLACTAISPHQRMQCHLQPWRRAFPNVDLPGFVFLTKKWQFLQCCRLGRPTPAPHRHLEVPRSAWWPHRKTHIFFIFFFGSCWQHVDSDQKLLTIAHGKEPCKPCEPWHLSKIDSSRNVILSISLFLCVSPKDAPTINPHSISTLWLFNVAMENGPFMDDFPTKTSIYKGFSMAMLNNQRVYQCQWPVCSVRHQPAPAPAAVPGEWPRRRRRAARWSGSESSAPGLRTIRHPGRRHRRNGLGHEAHKNAWAWATGNW